MLQERRSNRTEAAVREPREDWMISDLCHLFLGNRYIIIDTPTRLKRQGHTATDIDAAVLDRTTSTIGLFQLKWQDFNTYNVRTQRSRAKNFVNRVDAWVSAVEGWLEDFGKDRLCEVLRLQRNHGEQLADISLSPSAEQPLDSKAMVTHRSGTVQQCAPGRSSFGHVMK